MTQKAQVTKARIDKWDYLKFKNFYVSKDTINRVKQQPAEWKKIFASHISDKELISRIYKDLLQLSNKTSDNLILNVQRT